MKRKFLLIFFSILFFLSLVPLNFSGLKKNDPVTSKIDKLFSRWDKLNSPGASVAVMHNGKILFKKGYGSAQLEYEVPITPSTIFHVASVSKQFTAFSIVELAKDGKLSLDDDVRKYLPELPVFGKTITIRHLIHHTSGLRDQWELLAIAGWRLDDVITKEHIFSLIRKQKELNFDPGEEYLYCNTGYTLLAEIVHRVSGKSFAQWTKNNLFLPLDMKNTHFHDDHEKIVKNRSYSYVPASISGFKKRVLSYANVGATSLFTTAEDLLKWANNFFTKKLGGKKVLLQMEQRGILNNGKKIPYAFGVVIGEFKGQKTISHSGGDAGFRSHLLLFPEKQAAVAVLCNLGMMNPVLLARGTAEIFFQDFLKEDSPGKRSTQKKEIKVPPSIYQVYEGRYKLEDGNIITIFLKDDELIMRHTTTTTIMTLYPETMTKYFLKSADVQVQFFLEEDGYVNKVEFINNGKRIKGHRFKSNELNKSRINEYTGKYYCPELETTYSISFGKNGFVANHIRHGDILMVMNKKDILTGRKWFFRFLRFERNQGGEIKGFRLEGGRVRNLLFIKK